MFSRNIIVLVISQALGMTAAPVMAFLGGIIGTEIAPDPRLATLPIVAMVIGTAAFAIPAALLMKKIGRKAGFMFSAVMAGSAGILAAYAIAEHLFYLFCMTAFVMGWHMAFVQQYRFAAAESVAANKVGKAVSLVMLGGVFAAWFGPEVANKLKDALPWGTYTGSFVGVSFLMTITAVGLCFYQNQEFTPEASIRINRPLTTIIKQPKFIVASLSAAIGFGIMSFIMTATPISMHVVDGYSIDKTALVIQSHIMAMYLPSLIVGQLMSLISIRNTMLLGVAAMLSCILFALMGQTLWHYWIALIALGIGWNFLFIGGTTLLTYTYEAEERFGVQAINDFFVFTFQALATLASGVLMHVFGWNMILYFSIPLLLVTILLIFLLFDRKHPFALESSANN